MRLKKDLKSTFIQRKLSKIRMGGYYERGNKTYLLK